jgi:hypothetical protein
MTTVAQMIEWMKTLPQDAIVKCKEEVSGSYERYTVDSDVDIESCIVNSYTSEEDRIKYPTHAGKVYVYIEAS